MHRPAEEGVRRRVFDHPTQIHDAGPVRDVLDDREIMADEQIGQAKLLLQVAQQVDDLCLHRNVERRDGLIADDQAGQQNERAGNTDALALGARKGVLIALEIARI